MLGDRAEQWSLSGLSPCVNRSKETVFHRALSKQLISNTLAWFGIALTPCQVLDTGVILVRELQKIGGGVWGSDIKEGGI